MEKQNKTGNYAIVSGQRVYGLEANYSAIAKEAVKTFRFMRYISIAYAVYDEANANRQGKKYWKEPYAALVTFWAGFIEGVRTHKQKQREKKQREKNQLTEQELALVKAYRIADDNERRFLLNLANIMLECAQKSARLKHLRKKIEKAAGAATPTT